MKTLLARLLMMFAVALAAVRAASLDLAPPGAFTIVVIPDSQGYRGRGTKAEPNSTAPLTNRVFQNHTRWISENIGRQKIVFVSHVGDIVDINRHDQWRLARECLDRLHGVVAYGLTVGNHDMERGGNASLFQRYFGADRFAGFAWYGGCFEPERTDQAVSGNNVNSFQLFSAGGLDFVFLHLECNAPDDVLAWADAVLARHAGRRALISTHMDLGIREKPKTAEGFVSDPKGRMEWSKIHGTAGNTAAQMWQKLYRRHANLGFVFSGDQSRVTALREDRQGEHGNTVHALMSDYESSGPLRLYRFLPRENQVRVITFDTSKLEVTEKMRHVPSRDEHQFTIEYDMSPAVAPGR